MKTSHDIPKRFSEFISDLTLFCGACVGRGVLQSPFHTLFFQTSPNGQRIGLPPGGWQQHSPQAPPPCEQMNQI